MSIYVGSSDFGESSLGCETMRITLGTVLHLPTYFSHTHRGSQMFTGGLLSGSKVNQGDVDLDMFNEMTKMVAPWRN